MPFRDSWLVVGVLLIFAGFGAEQPIIGIIGTLVLVLGWVTRYWSRHVFDRVTLARVPSERRTFIGEEIDVEFTMTNAKPLPLPWYEWRFALSEPLTVPGEALGAAAVPGLKWLHRRGSLGWYQKHRWKFTVKPVERGFHQFGPATLRSADLLGAFPRSIEDDGKEHLIVFPAVSPLEDRGLPSDRPFGERRGGDPVFEDPLRIAGMREYRPGDPLKRIDWKATARSGDLRSRVYEPSATQQLYLLVNIDTMEHSWEGYLKEELERIVSVTASLAAWAAGARYSVGILANGLRLLGYRDIGAGGYRGFEGVTASGVTYHRAAFPKGHGAALVDHDGYPERMPEIARFLVDGEVCTEPQEPASRGFSYLSRIAWFVVLVGLIVIVGLLGAGTWLLSLAIGAWALLVLAVVLLLIYVGLRSV